MLARLRLATANSAPSEWMDGKYFAVALAAAIGLHMMALFVWHLMPPMQVVQVPVRVIDIKLGGSVTPAAPAPAVNSHAVENALSQATENEKSAREKHGKTAETTPKAKPLAHEANENHLTQGRAKVVGKFNVRPEKSAVAAPVMPVVARQFVRDTAMPAKPAAQQSQANVALNYEKAISHWIQKFKVYPEKARAAGMQGETVVRIRIDRQGNIGYYILEHSTGYPVLDQAAIDMIKRADPVPPVPAGYKGDTFEFLIPVSFHLQ